MSSADYVYILRDPDLRVMAARTVKHEMQRHIRQNLDAADRLYCHVLRVRTFGDHDPVLVRIPEFMAA